MAVAVWDEYVARRRSLRRFLAATPLLVLGGGALLGSLRSPGWVVGGVGFAWAMCLLLVLGRYAECECPRCRWPLCSRRLGRLFRRGCGHCGLPLTREAFETASKTPNQPLQLIGPQSRPGS